jgi:hypothetical protein
VGLLADWFFDGVNASWETNANVSIADEGDIRFTFNAVVAFASVVQVQDLSTKQ